MAASRDHGNNNTSGYSSSSSDEDENIGFPFEFLETADFQCIICHYVIRGFTELPCGHAGCKLCIEEWEKQKVACCKCRTAYDKTKKHRSLYNDREIIHKKQAHCKQHEKGCTWQGSIDDYKQQHRKKCLFRNVRCRLCNKKVARREKEGHKLTCTHRLVNCTTCGAQYRFINKKKHEDEECKVPCDYWQYGCHEKIHKPHMERHLANSARRHIELVKAYYDRIVAEKEKRLVMKNKALAEKDKLLAERNSSLVEKDKSLAEKNRLLAEKDKEIGVLNTTIVLQSERITELEGNEIPMATGGSKPTEKQQVTKPKPLPRTGIQLYDSQEQVTPKPAQPTTTKKDGKRIREIVFQGEPLKFRDVYKILFEKNFAKFGEIFQQNPNIVNSLRDDVGLGFTLLMMAVYEDRFDVFVHLMEYPQDFSLVSNYGLNVLHCVAGFRGTVRYLEMFDQQTIKKLINGRNDNNNTPLHIAAWNNNHDVIRWLLANGADHELKDDDGQRPDEQRQCDGVTKEIFRSFRSS